jgi:hypothetical protein
MATGRLTGLFDGADGKSCFGRKDSCSGAQRISARDLLSVLRECPAVSNEFERGWRGFLTDEEFEPAEVAILRPDCAEREFEQWQLRMRTDDQ